MGAAIIADWQEDKDGDRMMEGDNSIPHPDDPRLKAIGIDVRTTKELSKCQNVTVYNAI